MEETYRNNLKTKIEKYEIIFPQFFKKSCKVNVWKLNSKECLAKLLILSVKVITIWLYMYLKVLASLKSILRLCLTELKVDIDKLISRKQCKLLH